MKTGFTISPSPSSHRWECPRATIHWVGTLAWARNIPLRVGVGVFVMQHDPDPNAPFCFGLDIFPTWNGSPSLCIWKAPIDPLKASCHLFQKAFPVLTNTAPKSPSILDTSMHKITWIHLTHSNTLAYNSVSPVRLVLFLLISTPAHCLYYSWYSIIFIKLNQNWFNLIQNGYWEFKANFKSKLIQIGSCRECRIHPAQPTTHECLEKTQTRVYIQLQLEEVYKRKEWLLIE